MERYFAIDFGIYYSGRLGNQLFFVVSIFGAAKTLNRTPIVAYTADNDRVSLLKFARLVKVCYNLYTI